MNLHKTILKDCSFKSKSSLRTLYVRITSAKGTRNLIIVYYITLSLRSRRIPITFGFCLASWYVLAYVVRNVCQFIIFKFYIVTSQLELKISFVSSFLRNLVPFAYFARNDFYESKILKILTLPRSLD